MLELDRGLPARLVIRLSYRLLVVSQRNLHQGRSRKAGSSNKQAQSPVTAKARGSGNAALSGLLLYKLQATGTHAALGRSDALVLSRFSEHTHGP